MAQPSKSKSPKERKAPAKGRSRRPFAIDVHTHIRIPGLDDFMRKNPVRTKGPGSEDWFGATSIANVSGLDQIKIRWARLTDPKTRLREMNRQGIDIQVVSPNFPVTCYWMNGATGLKAAKLTNDTVAEFVAHDPDRFVGLANLPMQDAKRAGQELERCVTELGIRGAWIASNIRAKDLGDEKFWPFWAKAEQLDVPIFVHPLGTTDISRLTKYFLWNSIGQPYEEALAMASLIHEGVMDAFPKLKVVICHGGGYLPYYNGRSDWAHRDRKEVRENIKKPPGTYFRRFHYDTVIHDQDMLGILIKRAGLGQIMLGSDYPLVWEDAVNFIAKSRQLGKQEKDRIMWKNAARLLKIRL